MIHKLTYEFAKEHCSYMSDRIMDKLKEVGSFTIEEFEQWFPEDSDDSIGLVHNFLKHQGKEKEARRILYELLERDCPRVYAEANPGKPNVVQDVMDALIAEPFDKEKLARAAGAAGAAGDAWDTGGAGAARAAGAAGAAGGAWGARAAGAAGAARAAGGAWDTGAAIKKFQFQLSIKFFNLHFNLNLKVETNCETMKAATATLNDKDALEDYYEDVAANPEKKLKLKIIVKNKLNEMEEKVCTLENYEFETLAQCLTYLASQAFSSEDKIFKSLAIIAINQ